MNTNKSRIPYDTSGDAPGGCGQIKICVYGKTEQQARERYARACNEARLIRVEEERQEPNRFMIKWVERMTSLCDVIEFAGWRNRKKKNGE